MKIFFLISAMAFYVAGASAEPTVENEPGKPIALVFPSGNRAELRVARLDAIALPIEFQVSENSCTAGIGQKFEVTLGIRFDFYAWIWMQHSDPNKINQTLTYYLSDGRERPLSIGMMISHGSRDIAPESIAGLPSDEITFTDGVKWIPGLEDGVFREFTIESWNAESMFRNTQTGEIENRIASGEFGIRVAPGGGGTRGLIEHSRNGAFFSNLENHGFYLLGNVVTWNFRTGPTSTCEIAFKPNLGKAEQVLVDYIEKGKFEFKPIPGKQDGMAEALISELGGPLREAIE